MSSHRKYLLATLVSSSFLLAFGLVEPLSGDNELYQSMASDLIRFHSWPYLGTWDQNFPGIVYIHWFSIILLGNSTLSFRVFDLIVHIAMSGMLFIVLRRWLSPRTACLAILFYNLFYISETLGTAGQRDGYANVLFLLATLLLFNTRYSTEGSRRWSVGKVMGAGLCAAGMMALRPTYVAVIPLVLLYLRIASGEWKWSLAFLSGVALLSLLLTMPYLSAPGGLDQAYQSVVLYNLEIYGKYQRHLPWIYHQLNLRKLFLISGSLGVLIAATPSIRKHRVVRAVLDQVSSPTAGEKLLIGGYGLLGVASLIAMGKYWPYQFEPVILVLAPFGVVFFEIFGRLIPWGSARWMALTVLLLYCLLRELPIGMFYSFAANRVEHSNVGATDSLLNMYASVASYVNHNTLPNDRYECASRQAGIRWRSERMSASRFTTFYALTTFAPNGTHPEFQQVWRREYIDSLRSARPRLLVISHEAVDSTDLFPESPAQSIHEIPGFDSEILSHYRPDTTIGGYTILKRID